MSLESQQDVLAKFDGGTVSVCGFGFQSPGAQAAATVALTGATYDVAAAAEPSLQALGVIPQDRGFGIA
jgi:hypothetical protein